MFSIKRLIFSILAFLLFSCSSDKIVNSIDQSTNQVEIQTLSSDYTRNLFPSIEEDDIASIVKSNNTFSLDLYSKLATGNENLFFSPISITQLVAMIYSGSKGTTESQIKNTFYFSIPQCNLHPAFNALDLELAKRSMLEDDFYDQECFNLKITNSLWGQDASYFKTDFLDILAINYGAQMNILDFSINPDQARLKINRWVSDNTENKINNILGPGSIHNNTLLVLVNAIYFKAAWDIPFADTNTFNSSFYSNDKSTKITPFISNIAYNNYMRGDQFQVLELLYDGAKTSMVIFLPDKGTIDKFEAMLSNDKYNSIINRLEEIRVCATIPKFTYSSDAISLKKTLSLMGMPDCFTSKADFSGMSGLSNIRIDDILHKSFVKVDEAGTESAAASIGTMPCVGNEDPVDFFANSPFVFFIRDIPTGVILFQGKVATPNI